MPMEPVLSGSWNYPTRVLHGPGRVGELGAVSKGASISRPLIVTDTGLRDSSIIADVQKALAGTAPVYSGVKGNPTGANLDAGLESYKAGSCDGVIAVG